MARDFYEVLEVERTCTEVELKAAFRKKAMAHHPDRNDGCTEHEAKFKEVNEAYSILSDPQKRAAYDRFGHAGVGGGQGGFGGGGQQGFTDIHDIFNEVFGDAFGDMFGARRPGGAQRGQDLRYDLEVTLEQAYSGSDVEIAIPAALTCEPCKGSGCKDGSKPQTCSTCGGAGRVRASQGFFAIERTCPRCGGQGRMITDPCAACHGNGMVRKQRTLQVRIPPGVDDGARIRLAGEGDAGAHNGPRGDLYIFLSVKPHDLFERDGLDLHCTVPVPMCTAALGGDIESPCLKETATCECRVTVKVPEGAQTGRTVRLKGKGMPSLRSRERGDLVVELYVETPTKLTARQKELMAELAASCGSKHHPRCDGFLGKAKTFWAKLAGSEESAA
jgi:molecular chaperone DnaJ